MEDTQLKELLTQYRRVHMIGISPSTERPSFRVAQYLLQHDFELVGIRPNSDEILGAPCFDDLNSAPQPIEIVDVFRASEFVPQIADAAIANNAKILWLQEGVTHPEAEKKARDAGLIVISNKCIKKEHTRLFS